MKPLLTSLLVALVAICVGRVFDAPNGTSHIDHWRLGQVDNIQQCSAAVADLVCSVYPPGDPTLNSAALGAPTPPSAAAIRLRTANIVLSAPHVIRAGHHGVVEIVLSGTLDKQALAAELSELKATGTYTITTKWNADRIRATLFGADFDVRPSEAQEQLAIDTNDVVRWEWEVTPQKPGEQKLVLFLDAVVNWNGKDNVSRFGFIAVTLDVATAWPETLADWMDVAKDASWFWTAILTPTSLFLYHLILRRRGAPRSTDKVKDEPPATAA